MQTCLRWGCLLVSCVPLPAPSTHASPGQACVRSLIISAAQQARQAHLVCSCAATDMMSRTGELSPGIGTTKKFKATADGRGQLHSSSAAMASAAAGDPAVIFSREQSNGGFGVRSEFHCTRWLSTIVPGPFPFRISSHVNDPISLSFDC